MTIDDPDSAPFTVAVATAPLFAAILVQYSVPLGDDAESIGAEAWVATAASAGVARVAYAIDEPHPEGYGTEPGALLLQAARAFAERRAALSGVPWRDVELRHVAEPAELRLVLLSLSLLAPALVEAVARETNCDALHAACAHALERRGTVEVVEGAVGARERR